MEDIKIKGKDLFDSIEMTEEEIENMQDAHEDLLIWLSEKQLEAAENAMLKEEEKLMKRALQNINKLLYNLNK